MNTVLNTAPAELLLTLLAHVLVTQEMQARPHTVYISTFSHPNKVTQASCFAQGTLTATIDHKVSETFH